MQPINIRSATAADLDAIATNNICLALETENRTLDPETVRAGVRRVLDDPARGVYWLAELGGNVVGQLLVTREWSDWRNGWFWWIQSVFVMHHARRTGVYRRLHAHVLAEGRKAAVRSIRLYVEIHNRQAQQVYECLGMIRAGYIMYEQTLEADS